MITANMELTKMVRKQVPVLQHRLPKTGYGRRIPTSWMVKHRNRWRRVYCCCFSNSGTNYIEDGSRDRWIVIN